MFVRFLVDPISLLIYFTCIASAPRTRERKLVAVKGLGEKGDDALNGGR